MSLLNLNKDALVNTVPTKPGKEGQTTTTQAKKLDGSSVTQYWQYTNGKWKQINKSKYNTANPEAKNYTALGVPSVTTAGSLRYPNDVATAEESDYVLFEFYKYQPPFQGINRGATTGGSSAVSAYNQSVADEKFYEKQTVGPVVLYMPEDISTGYKANWSGKSFSNMGREVLAAAGSGDLGQALGNASQFAETGLNMLLPNVGNKLIRETISKITGEQVSQNDVFGSTRGLILNPNVELLFGGVDLRNFQLNYKLVPRNDTEAAAIESIIKTFKKAMLPSFAEAGDLTFSSADATPDNFIRVPNVCRVSFMKGSDVNSHVPQYKMCAITQVDVNYTPDGAYATYGDGRMVAYQLSLNFQETKLIFAEESDKY